EARLQLRDRRGRGAVVDDGDLVRRMRGAEQRADAGERAERALVVEHERDDAAAFDRRGRIALALGRVHARGPTPTARSASTMRRRTRRAGACFATRARAATHAAGGG